MDLTCIRCPMGCAIHVEMENGQVVSVTGNTCPRGAEYAKSEATAPVRTVTSTVRALGGVRPVVAVARHGLLSEADWAAWLGALPPRLGEAEQAYADSDWLARRHDLVTFFTSLYLEADQSTDERVRALKPPLVAALKTVP